MPRAHIIGLLVLGCCLGMGALGSCLPPQYGASIPPPPITGQASNENVEGGITQTRDEFTGQTSLIFEWDGFSVFNVTGTGPDFIISYHSYGGHSYYDCARVDALADGSVLALPEFQPGHTGRTYRLRSQVPPSVVEQIAAARNAVRIRFCNDIVTLGVPQLVRLREYLSRWNRLSVPLTDAGGLP
jgi:hypothetical protein